MNTKEYQKELWDVFLKKHGCNYYFVCLSTKEYLSNLKELGVTKKSPNSLKAKAENLPVVTVEIGKDKEGGTFYSSFAYGKKVTSCFIRGKGGIKLKKTGFSTPDEAYDFIIERATFYNTTFK